MSCTQVYRRELTTLVGRQSEPSNCIYGLISTLVPGVQIMEIKVAARNREGTFRLSAALWTPETGLRHIMSHLTMQLPVNWLRYCHKQRLPINLFFSEVCTFFASLLSSFCSKFILILFHHLYQFNLLFHLFTCNQGQHPKTRVILAVSWFFLCHRIFEKKKFFRFLNRLHQNKEIVLF